jgi:hypothetical protein
VAAPGWYEDPQAPGGKRWWDGTQWTEHVAVPDRGPAPVAAAQAAPAQAVPSQPEAPYPVERIGLIVIGGVAALLLIVGSVGTWVSVQTTGPFNIGASRGGLDRDGAITLVLAVLALILIAIWAVRVGPPATRIALSAVAGGLALLAALICVADIIDIESNGNDIVDSSAGWGLWLCLIASLALLASMVVALVVQRLR